MSETQTVSFAQTGRVFVLHNAGLRPRNVGFIGFSWTVPARDAIVYPNAQFPDVPHSGKDADGDWIPGTVEISDGRIGGTHSGEEDRFFDAQMAVTHILGIVQGQALGHHAKSGLSLLPQKPTKDQVREVFAQGKARFEASLLDSAQAIVSDHEARNEARRRNGEPVMPAAANVRKAMELVALAVQEENKSIAAMLGHPVPAVAIEDVDEDELTLAVAVKAKAIAVSALPQGTPEQHAALAEDLATDPATADKIRKAINASRKRAPATLPRVTIPEVAPQIVDPRLAGAEPAGG